MQSIEILIVIVSIQYPATAPRASRGKLPALKQARAIQHDGVQTSAADDKEKAALRRVAPLLS